VVKITPIKSERPVEIINKLLTDGNVADR